MISHSDMQYIAAGGRSRTIKVIKLETCSLKLNLELPVESSGTKQLQFIAHLSGMKTEQVVC